MSEHRPRWVYAVLLGGLLAPTAAAATCEKPTEQIAKEEKRRIAGEVEARVMAIRGAGSGSHETSTAYTALVPDQDVVNMRWRLYELCKLHQTGALTQQQYCVATNVVSTPNRSVEHIEAECAAKPEPAPEPASTAARSAPAPSRAPGTCAPVTPIDSTVIRLKVAEGLQALWDGAAEYGYVFGHKAKELARVDADGRVKIEREPGRAAEMYVNATAYGVPEADLQGWRLVRDLSVALVNNKGVALDLTALTSSEGEVFDALVLPGEAPVLVTASVSWETRRRHVDLRTWRLHPECFAR